MALATGTRLGPYEIVAALGAGGMGEVYQARDTRLDRTVAIKVLPSELNTDPERRARFEREARTIAALNHPHICTLHDIGQHDGATYLVMEHLVGETLAQRLRKGPLPVPQALEVGAQVAEALDAAHKAGIVHRDLKPANVMLTKSGATLLDFGLAKLRPEEGVRLASDDPAAVTRARNVTTEGTLVGTLPYMAPEQLQGCEADSRTDIWALGCLIYEMVSGRPAFEGASTASLIGAILERQPVPLATLQAMTPPWLDRLVRICLAKSPADRPDTAHDLANDLRWMQEVGASETPGRVAPLPTRRPSLRKVAPVLTAALLGAAATAWVMTSRRSEVPSAPLLRAEIGVVPAESVDAGGAVQPLSRTPGGFGTALTWMPDGRSLVFVGRRDGVQQLYVRALDGAEAKPLAGTEGARVPAVSPDGQWVAFWANRSLKAVSLAGGPAMELARNMDYPPKGLTWDGRGRLFFGQGRGGGSIWQVSAGGNPVAVTTPAADERAHILPSVLPGDRAILYTVRKRTWTWGEEEVVALELATGQRKVVLHEAMDARYESSGHLLFLRSGGLFAVPFDAERLEVTGPPVPVVEDVAQGLVAPTISELTGAGQFATARNGALAWISGTPTTFPSVSLVTVDRTGRVTSLGAPTRAYGWTLRVSPNGRRLAVTIEGLTEIGLWLYDIDRNLLAPLHRVGETSYPVWSDDGQRIVFTWLTEGRYYLAAQRADAPGAPEVLGSVSAFRPTSWIRGRPLVGVLGALDDADVGSATLDQGPLRLEPVVRTSDVEAWPEVSPDGRWLAYGSDVSGRVEVYVQPYPTGGARTLVSSDGGDSPAWHPSGRELLYVGPSEATGRRRMMAVTFEPSSPPRVGPPRVLFEFDSRSLTFSTGVCRAYDLAPDGKRFFVLQVRPEPPPPVVTHINLIQNWVEQLKAKVPSGTR